MDIQEHIRKQLVKALVQRLIFCPIEKTVLDIRTCVVVVDSDGDPALVLSQEGWAKIAAVPNALNEGYSVDETTVRK